MRGLNFKVGKRITALIAAVSISVCGLFGCGNKADKDEHGRTVISVGVWSPSAEGFLKKQEQVALFMEDNPDVAVIPEEWQLDLKLFNSRAEGGRLPNLYYVNFTELSQIMQKGYSCDITDVLEKYDYKDKFNPILTDLISRDGKYYAFPYEGYLTGLTYNTKLFEMAGLMEDDGTPKQPKDWNEVAEFAVKIKEATGCPGFMLPTAQNNGGWLFTNIAWSYGVEFMSKDSHGKWKAVFNSPEMREALQYVKDLKWKYDVLPANTLIDNTEYHKLFGTGKIGMMIGTGGSYSTYAQYDMEPNDFGFMAIPRGPKSWVTLLGGGSYAFSNTSTKDQIDACIRWAKMSYSYELTDEYKEKVNQSLQNALENNYAVGLCKFSCWDADSPADKYRDDLYKENTNINLNHVKLYNDFVTNPGECIVRPEEPVCAQELYGILDECIQEVITNPDANVEALVEKACSDFQYNYLDNIDF